MDSVSYYTTIKSSYERLYLKEQESKIRFLLSKVRINPSDTILDVGAGSGILESLLPNNKIVAVEPSDMVDLIADRKLSNVSIVKTRIEDFVYHGKFNAVFCITVLQDISGGIDGIMEKLFDLTAENGFLVVSVLKISQIDLNRFNPIESGCIENDKYFVFKR
ncbi:methyltransferase domain-containing protein [Candidatus Parvarchaeota archaeon]|nr:methyltransferase domain-containing protein [Candidatus Parvarchaeota archaeon]